MAHPTRVVGVRDRFPGGEFTTLLISCLNGSNEGIIDREAEMRGFVVKFGERPLEGEGMWISRKVPHEQLCYGVRGMHMGRYLVYAGLNCGVMSQDGRNAFPWHGLLN